jgi:pimeloyl-ACP methyl ester carboxylesterase
MPLLEQPARAIDLPPVSIRGGPDRFETPPGIDAIAIADWAAAVVAAADDAGFDRFVLVGHSLAGLTLGEVARRAPERIAHLVFVSAMVPSQGETALSALPPEVMERAGGGLTDEMISEMFCSDMDAEQRRFVLERVGIEALNVMVEPVDRAGIPGDLGMTYVRLLRDQALPPAAQDASIAALRAVPGGPVDVVEIDSGHNVMISRPEALAPVIEAIRSA